MKTRKRELLVVLLLVICAAFLFLGCPPTGEDPDDGDNGDGGGEPAQPQQYEIRLSFPHEYGEVTVNPPSRMAARGDRVTVTLKPSAGYEPWGLLIHNASFYGLELTPEIISNVYTYYFTMDASIVTVIVNFVPLLTAISNWTDRILPASDWKYMDALSALIQKAPNPTDPTVMAAERRLAGNARPAAGSEPTGGDDNIGAVGSEIWRRYESSPYTQGVIRQKIRNADLKDWFPSTMKWPSEIEKGADLILFEYNDAATPIPEIAPAAAPPPPINSFSDSLGTDLTILYYVNEDNPTIPAPAAGTGWSVGTRVPVTSVNNNVLFEDYLGPNLEAVQEIPLVFDVGINNTYPVYYRLWLWPVAQYTLENNLGASANTTVRLQDYEWEDSDPYPAGSWEARGDPKPLSASNSKAIGFVGRADTSGDGYSPPERPDAPFDFSVIDKAAKEVMVEISTTRTGVVIGVYTSTGFIVRDVFGDILNYITAGTPGYFCPDSTQYIIRVRPSTPPSGF